MVIEDYISSISSRRCGEAALKVITKTSHMVRARSVALGAAYCIFAARLAEAIGAVSDFTSILPGKGLLTHQILALALPMIYYDGFKNEFLNGRLSRGSTREYVERALDKLRDAGIFNVEKIGERDLRASITNAVEMIHTLSQHAWRLVYSIGLRQDYIQLYTELMLYSYRFHIVGVIDALLEDAVNKRAVIVEWKTESTPRKWELAQGYIYALLEAERLGYDDPVSAVRDHEYVVPVVVRPRGDIKLYSVADKYRTAGRTFDKDGLIRNILLASQHLVLTITDYRRYLDNNTVELCRIKGGRGRRISVFRKKPDELPSYNPRRNQKYPCRICRYRDACLFYIASYEEWTLLDRIAYKTRHAIYGVRENALRPIKEFYDLYTSSGDLREFYENIERLENVLRESNNRIDHFEYALIEPGSYMVSLKRGIRDYERREVPPRLRTIREGKPVIVLFYDPHIDNPLTWLSFHGRVEEVEVYENDYLEVKVVAPNNASRLQVLALNEILSSNQHMLRNTIALETNVDLTQLELQAVDAFQRASKNVLRGLVDNKENLKTLSERVRKEMRSFFAVLFAGQLLKGEE